MDLRCRDSNTQTSEKLEAASREEAGGWRKRPDEEGAAERPVVAPNSVEEEGEEDRKMESYRDEDVVICVGFESASVDWRGRWIFGCDLFDWFDLEF